MALFNAYFDTSGTSRDTGKAHALYVAGFVSTVAKWQRFEGAWSALLEKYGIPAPLHMTDFMAGKGRYADWFDSGGGEASRDSFRREAIQLLKRDTNQPIAVGVVLKGFRRMFDEYEIPDSESRDPFIWSSIRVCHRLIEWTDNRVKSGRSAQTDKLDVVFEDGDAHMSELKRLAWQRHHVIIHSRPNYDKTFAPFAACDFLAWEFRNWTRDRLTGYFFRDIMVAEETSRERKVARMREAAVKIKPSPVMLDVIRLLPRSSLHYAGWDALSRYCEHQEFPRRT